MTGRCTKGMTPRAPFGLRRWLLVPGPSNSFIRSAWLRTAIASCWILFGAVSAGAKPLRVLAFGDSLSAGYMLPAGAAFPAVLEKQLQADGYDAEVVNAAVSGDTTAGGLVRLAYALQDGADLVIVELGANDMLRGADPNIARENLEKIIAECTVRGARVLLAGMLASGNFGPAYKREFDAIYPDLAKRFSLPLYPFFLEGVAGNASLVLDGLHPNASGVARIVAGIAPLVGQSLAGLRGGREHERVTRERVTK